MIYNYINFLKNESKYGNSEGGYLGHGYGGKYSKNGYGLYDFYKTTPFFDLTKLVTIINIEKDDNGNWIYISPTNKYFLSKENAPTISLINDKFADFVNNGHPITKYFETDSKNNITYVANFAVDIIAMKGKEVYLIERKDGRGWALPGGFIDAGETAEEAVLREFKEETEVDKDDIKGVKALDIVRTTDPREIYFYTYPYIMFMKDTTELGYADDAKDGKWIQIDDAIKMKLAFSHHNEILKTARTYFY